MPNPGVRPFSITGNGGDGLAIAALVIGYLDIVGLIIAIAVATRG